MSDDAKCAELVKQPVGRDSLLNGCVTGSQAGENHKLQAALSKACIV